MFQLIASPFQALINGAVHVLATLTARVMNHPAVREVLEAIISNANRRQSHLQNQLRQQQPQPQSADSDSHEVTMNDNKSISPRRDEPKTMAPSIVPSHFPEKLSSPISNEHEEPTFFYKEILGSHSRHLIIVVEAPLTRETPIQLHNNESTTTTSTKPLLDLSITTNGNLVYHTPVKEDVVMAENLDDFADPDGYLWSITRRAAHRAASIAHHAEE